MTSNTAMNPTQASERILAIDVLRGCALLGILMVNIQSFGMIDQSYLNPTATGPLSTTDYFCWLFVYLFFDSKMHAIFSALFGAGIVLMWERSKKAERPFTFLHYRRMFWLLIIGLAHAHLIWHGDILVPYALCGMIFYWVCGWRPWWLLTAGLALLATGSVLSVLTGMSMPYWPEESIAEMAAGWSPTVEQIAANKAQYLGNWVEQLPHRSQTAFMFETFLFFFVWFWRAGGLMLLGMAFFKWGIFQQSRSRKFYTMGFTIGLLIGLSLIVVGVVMHEYHDWSLEFSFFQGHQFNYWGSLFVSFAYVCIVMLVVNHGWWSRSLAAVGRMALTNYLAHSIVCTTLFYGHGFGWFGQLSRIQLIGIVVAIWAVQLVFSPIWLSYFRFGPFEWLWRSLSYWRWQPMIQCRRSIENSPNSR